MPATVLLGVLLVVAPAAYLVNQAFATSGRTLAIARRNLTWGLGARVLEVGSLESRGTGLDALLRVLTPDRAAARMRRLIGLAGFAGGRGMSRALWAKLIVGATGAVIGLLTFAATPGPFTLLVAAGLAVGGYFVPDLVVYGRGTERQDAIRNALPDTLDQMTIAVEAGLGFDAALTRAAANGKGPLAEELSRTLHDITVGRPRREAYAALAQRTDVEDLRRFVAAVNQADSYGIAVADVLRAQAEDLRDKRRQRAEKKAMEIPVKVVFPLMACILPALMIVVVGPAVMELMRVL
ncbi:type II secretion system F family protein [Candidatus Blastococcus massiliensis]|uniref:type II secretion system F family protein n=1 Tax=Candidatus Blastococcus massiliensis TaxID=1470358 RepID=UPI0004B1945A|nr:type II secretion system F family protein [Candidatus Blastococcus massiliensis]